MKHQGYPYIITVLKLEATQIIARKPLVFPLPPVYNQRVSSCCRYSFSLSPWLCHRRIMDLTVRTSGAIPLKSITRD